eukprot:m.253070 g.253070  ORF g.253070 m.253070 type:complete len:248 (-) comp19576_c0_seq7:122-865(-)
MSIEVTAFIEVIQMYRYNPWLNVRSCSCLPVLRYKTNCTLVVPSQDSEFYRIPRLVQHIDDNAIAAIRSHYEAVLPPKADVLDLCSSWISHFPNPRIWQSGKCIGLGMNADELQQNVRLSDFVVQDLNENPHLPFGTATFDVVTCVVSIDYLSKPLTVLKEIGCVLKPGGLLLVSQSNRCFPSKVVSMWLNTNDAEHCWIIGSYIHYSGAFDPPTVQDLTIGDGDPVFMISAVRRNDIGGKSSLRWQ